tara:strand:+ start:8721 stop:9677 length:957 start_codon:yes stop_codon:yes gene_type:complete
MAKNKMLVVYNTCGFGRQEKVEWYIDCLNNILNQEFEDFQVVVSSCGNSVPVIKELLQAFGTRIAYNFINERITVNQSFNHTVQESVKRYGEFDSYLYVDSGINFRDNKDVLTKTYELYKSGPYGMVTVQASNDTGFKEWLNIDGAITGENLVLPVGRACNLHTQLFSNEILQAYDTKIIPDIFVAYCTESVFSFVAAGAGQKWVILKDLVLEHLKSVDGATSGFSHIGPKGDSTNNLFGGLDIREIVANPEAKDSGFGYEEMQGVFPHDPDKYEDGFVKEPARLKEFIRTNMFLNKEAFDYAKVQHKFLMSKEQENI